MRKFRVWCKDRNEWETDICLLSPDGILLHRVRGAWVPLREESHIIEFCTGSKDKNGKEIYEGDIVKMHYFFENHDPVSLGVFEDENEIIGVVEIDALSTYTEYKGNRYDWINYLEEPNEELEVIGNIHDDRKLLNEVEP